MSSSVYTDSGQGHSGDEDDRLTGRQRLNVYLPPRPPIQNRLLEDSSQQDKDGSGGGGGPVGGSHRWMNKPAPPQRGGRNQDSVSPSSCDRGGEIVVPGEMVDINECRTNRIA